MIGRTISHYRVTEKLGEGGMGVVYRAEDTKLKRSVALKFLASHLIGAAEEKERFIREAQAAAALDHPNICTVHEIDEAEGQIFIAMAYLEGETLARRIEAGPLKLGEALDFAIQTAKGLQEAHAKSIFHRDIKPANLMITTTRTSEQLVKIMDFGLAQLAERSRLTRQDTTLGTIAYMSPEQSVGSGTDHRTDIWSLGVVLYEMVSGRLPFLGDYAQAITYSITAEEPEPLTALRTGVPMELEWLVTKCLAKDTGERYQSTSDLIVDLATLGKKIESGKSTILLPSTPVVSGVRSQGSAGLQTQRAVQPDKQRLSLRALPLARLRWTAGRRSDAARLGPCATKGPRPPPLVSGFTWRLRLCFWWRCSRFRLCISVKRRRRRPSAASFSALKTSLRMCPAGRPFHRTGSTSPTSPEIHSRRSGSVICSGKSRAKCPVPRARKDRSGRPTASSSDLAPKVS